MFLKKNYKKFAWCLAVPIYIRDRIFGGYALSKDWVVLRDSHFKN
tara:strand:+ start:96 stop:230 length:135 start_codon:yes stop_codon:yes gene_type:complete